MKARFHLPNFSAYYKFNLCFAEMLAQCPECFREGVEIASVYGAFPPSLWNGGRAEEGIASPSFMKGVINAFNERGIPLRFTFTNPMIEKKHLRDDFCNMVLRLADNGMNEVIVMSPILEEYIRTNYPGYKITSSTCKRLNNPEQLLGEVEKDYHIIVIDYDLNHDFETLSKIPDKTKCELLVNASCTPNCKLRSDHYNAIGVQQIAYATHVMKYKDAPFDEGKLLKEHPEIARYTSCPYATRTIFDIKELKNHISPDEIWGTYIPMGFEQFKLEGRTANMFNLMEHYLYYMAKPEYVDRLRYDFLNCLAENGVFKVLE